LISLFKRTYSKRRTTLGPETAYNEALKINLKANIAKLHETFTIKAVHAVDWICDEQISYVISDG
jgi:hypothetical protein